MSARALLVVAALGVGGCCFGGSGAGAGGQPSASSAASPGRDSFETFAANLQEGRHYGEGAGAEPIAAELRTGLEPRDGVAVRIIETAGAPRRVIVLVRFDDDAQEGLADLSEARRQEYLDDILAMLDDDMGTEDDEIGVGIRGSFFYGAVATRRPGEPPQYSVGSIITTDALEAMFAPPAPAAAPAVPAVAAPPASTP